MRALVINLDRSSERLAAIHSQLDSLGLPFERLPGVDGRTLSQQERDAFESCHRRDVRWMPGEIGNFLSHLKAWQRIASSVDGWWLILEDDATLSSRLPAFIQKLPTVDLPRASAVKIETMGNKVLLSRQPVGTIAGVVVHRLRSPHMGTAGYFVDRAAAIALAERHEHMKDTTDAFWIPAVAKSIGIGLYQTVPALVIQDAIANAVGAGRNLASLIDAERMRRPAPTFLQEVRSRLRKPLSRRLAIGPRQRIPFGQ